MGLRQCSVDLQSLTILGLSFVAPANAAQSITKVIMCVLAFGEYLQAESILFDRIIIPVQAAQRVRKFVVCIAIICICLDHPAIELGCFLIRSNSLVFVALMAKDIAEQGWIESIILVNLCTHLQLMERL